MSKVSEGYKETEIGIIPEDWDISDIKKICKITTGKKNTQDKVDDGIYPFFVRSQKIEHLDSYSYDEEAVLTAGDGVGTGKVFHYINGKFDVHQRVYKMSDFIKEYNALFFYYYFSQSFYDRVKRMSAKTSVDSVRMEMIAEMQVPMPGITEQQRIAEILSTTDAHIEKLDKSIEDYQLLKKGMMKKLLTEGIGHTEFKDTEIGRIPKAWEVRALGEIADKNDKYSFTGGPFGSDLKSSDYTTAGVRVIQLQNMGDGYFNNGSKVYTSIEKADQLVSCNIYPNDIIIAKMAEPVARACKLPMFESRYLMCSDGIRLNVNRNLADVDYCLYAINSTAFRQNAIDNSTGSTRLRIGLTTLRSLLIAVPSLEEQKAIASILIAIDDILVKKVEVRNDFVSLKKALTEKLLTGKIRVNQ